MIECHPMCDAPAPIVSGNRKSFEAERTHRRNLIVRSRALRIDQMCLVAWGLIAVAVAAQIGCHDSEVLRQHRRDFVPHHVRLRIAVKKQKRRTAATDSGIDVKTVCAGEAPRCKTFEHNGMRVIGGGGVALHVLDEGNPEGPPILFIHGYCQSTFAWRKQFAGDLGRDFRLIAFDLRGHGESDKPADAAAYTDSKFWADDVAAVIDALALQNVTLAGWSYGGYVIADYLRFYGAGRVRAVAFVCALTLKGGEKARGFTGARFAALFPALFSPDPEVLRPAMARFVDLCVADPSLLPENDRVKL